jgi:hypothetical protein
MDVSSMLLAVGSGCWLMLLLRASMGFQGQVMDRNSCDCSVVIQALVKLSSVVNA